MAHAFLRLLLLVVTAMLATAGPAAAQRCNAPPGTAAVDQYCENVPSATGNGGGSDGSSGATAPQSTVRALDRAGESGQELKRFLGEDVASAQGQSGKKRLSERAADRKTQKPEPTGKAPAQPSSNPLGAVQSAVNSGTTVGSGFTWLLVSLTLLIAGIAWMRYRRGSSS
jgi:hypothetical protein